ncbi:MAG: hypothetical protein KAT32_00745 [Candidatus Moranbacteria bacterium]|nr:hypothetical protein [Candidatus Moranbacteria bacterium]
MELIITISNIVILFVAVFTIGMFKGFVSGVKCKKEDREVCRSSSNELEIIRCFLRNIFSR